MRNLILFLLYPCIAFPLFAQPRDLTLADFRPHDGAWQTAGDAQLAGPEGKELALAPGDALIANGTIGKTTNLLTQEEFRDVEVHLEFMVPQDSNSGVYLMGRYEVQITDSFGVEEPRHSDTGGIYQRWEPSEEKWGHGYQGVAPRVNAAKPAGEWQTLDILFRAPRFDGAGNKLEDAVFVQVTLNGQVVQQNTPLTGPTRAASFSDEAPNGPLMLQGDHGPVAYRNIRLRDLDLDHTGAVIGQWQMLDLENDFEIALGVEAPGATAEEVFEVKDGEIHAMNRWNREGMTPSGLIVSKQRYSYFDIEFEIRAGERGFEPRVGKHKNGGFLYHIQGTTPVWPPSLECQGMETNLGDHWSIRGVNCHKLEADGTLVEVPRRDFSYGSKWFSPERPGWNRVRVEVRGDRARYFVNGEQVNEIRQAVFGGVPCTAGFIGFQAEHAEMSYRNLRIRHVGLY